MKVTSSGVLKRMHASVAPNRNVQWFRGGLIFKADRLMYHSTLGLRVIKEKKVTSSGVP